MEVDIQVDIQTGYSNWIFILAKTHPSWIFKFR